MAWLTAILVVLAQNHVLALTWTLGPENIQVYPEPHPYQFPDAAFEVFDDENVTGARLMFWSDGTTYRVVGPQGSLFPNNTPSPITPVLTNGTLGTYDGNGNWMLHVQRVSNGTLVGFTHAENHVWACPGTGYGEWNVGAVVTSEDDGVSWTRQGLAVADPQPCNATFGGNGYSSVLPSPGGGFMGYGGCSAYRSLDEGGAAGTWSRWYDGGFSQPGVNGSQTCLPGVPSNACCPIVHWNSFLDRFVMIYTTWGNSTTLFLAISEDGLSWGEGAVLLQVQEPRAIAYGQIIGDHNSSVAGATGTLAYAAAPPTSGYPRDFVYRTITFTN